MTPGRECHSSNGASLSRLPLDVNADECIPARVLRAEIAHETGLRSDLDMPGIVAALEIHEHRATRRRVRIVNRKLLETVVAHQLITGLLCQRSFRVGRHRS